MTDKIRAKLKLFRDRTIEHHDELDSTMSFARSNAFRLGERAAIIAKRQTAGRGRLERQFFSPEGGLYMTVLLMGSHNLLTVAAGVAVAQTLREYGINAEIKWVNDVLCQSKKLCGILAQSYTIDGKVFSAVGIGVNIAKQIYPDGLCAASAEEFTDGTIDMATFTADVLNRLDYYLLEENAKEAVKLYREYSCLLGKAVVFDGGSGIAYAVDDNGALIVKLDGGVFRLLRAGEVSLRLKH